MGLAAIAQILELIDPIIFGKIIDNFAVNTDGRNQQELVNGVLRLLALAVGIALLARLAHAFTDYFTRLVVQKFGLSIPDMVFDNKALGADTGISCRRCVAGRTDRPAEQENKDHSALRDTGNQQDERRHHRVTQEY